MESKFGSNSQAKQPEATNQTREAMGRNPILFLWAILALELNSGLLKNSSRVAEQLPLYALLKTKMEDPEVSLMLNSHPTLRRRRA